MTPEEKRFAQERYRALLVRHRKNEAQKKLVHLVKFARESKKISLIRKKLYA